MLNLKRNVQRLVCFFTDDKIDRLHVASIKISFSDCWLKCERNDE